MDRKLLFHHQSKEGALKMDSWPEIPQFCVHLLEKLYFLRRLFKNFLKMSIRVTSLIKNKITRNFVLITKCEPKVLLVKKKTSGYSIFKYNFFLKILL